jgi:hypothetical protein
VYQHPYIASQAANQRQRELLAQAERHRQARHLVQLARASRRAGRAERRLRQAIRKALQLRAGLQQ